MSRLARLALHLIAPLLATSVSAQTCQRAPRNCSQEDGAFTRQVRRLTRAHSDAASALESLRLRRLATCHDYNACGIESAELDRVRQWSDAELNGLRAAASSDTSRAAWARSFAMRAALVSASSVQSAQAVIARPQMTPAVRQSIARMESDIESWHALQPLLRPIREGARVPQGRAVRAPPICNGPARRSLRAIVREGGGASSRARAIRDTLDDLCERFERYAQPTEALQNRMRSFLTRLTRIEGWMNDIRGCHTGNYVFRCENTFGPRQEGAMPQTQLALRMVAEVRRAVGNIPETSFPCGHAIWRRVEESQWTLRTARAQIPGLARQAKSLCEAIGVDADEVATVTRRLQERLEQTEAQATQELRTRRASLAQIREAYGLTE